MDVKHNLMRHLFVFTLTFVSLICLYGKKNDPIIDRVSPNPNVIAMPLVLDTDPVTAKLYWGALQEDRGPEFNRFLAVSVLISTNQASGSGTIVYYDQEKNEAYVASCGHLWQDNRTAAELRHNPESCEVVTWYHNQIKLDKPKKYPATVLFWSNTRGFDSSLIKFKPDWKPNYFKIAPLDYALLPGAHYHSCGCDSGLEVARYDVEIVGYRGDDLIVTRNSPRQGRSGGGLLSNDGFYVGTCWGSSDVYNGGGIGYFTPLKSIHAVYKSNKFEWLLNLDSTPLARKMPIRDMNNPQGRYPEDYIQFPDENSLDIPSLRN